MKFSKREGTLRTLYQGSLNYRHEISYDFGLCVELGLDAAETETAACSVTYFSAIFKCNLFENFPEQDLLWYKCLDNEFLETLFRAREAGLK